MDSEQRSEEVSEGATNPHVPGWVAMLIHQALDPRDPVAQHKAASLLHKRGYAWALELATV